MRILILWLLIASSSAFSQTKKDITLDDIYKQNTFRQDVVTGFRSMKDGQFFSEINTDGILQKVRFSDGNVEKDLVNLKKLTFQDSSLKVDDYRFNDDETKILLLTESENIYRRSILNKVYVYDIATAEIQLINEKKVLHASFSPLSDKVAYVLDNNLFYYDLTENENHQITKDGDYNLIHGNCDWVYEEEFSFTKAYEWSAKGDYLVYYTFNQQDVPEYNFAMYDKLYPTDYKYKYPKAGERNSEVSIHAFHVKRGKTVKCDIGDEKDIYVPRIKIDGFDNSIIIYRMNRLQNKLEILKTNPQDGLSTVIYEEQNPSYIEISDDIYFLKKEDAFIYTSEKSGFRHIYKHDVATNQSIQLTKGNWEVVSLYGVDEKNGDVYFLSCMDSPLERYLHAINLQGENSRVITSQKGWHQIDWSEGFEFYLDKYSTVSQVPVYAIYNKQGKLIRTLKDNHKLVEKMKEFNLSQVELITVPNDKEDQLNAWILKPSNFSPTKKYPLLMFQYSGPGSQQVMNSFGGRDMWWYQMLAQKGYIIVCVDGTGTGFRGEAFKKATYLQLGKYESDDQIAAARYFAKQTYIDASRIGIWGWSYGGYMSSICLMKGSDVFKMAIAVAPVTNWRYYDNIYTERYMRTPAENAKGYDDNSPVNMVSNLKGKYLLIHGSADDNVHYQNTMMMIDALVKANKEFDSEIYPNKNHGISGGNTRYHLYNRMTKYILENL